MSGPRCSLVVLVSGLALTCATLGAQAQSPGQSPDYAAAKRHYQAAETASAAGDHAAAAREYGVAYDITKDPILFFKIGQAHDQAGDCRTAETYYRRYLEEAKPAAEHRQRTEALLAACASRPPAAPPPPAGAPSGSPPSPGAVTGSAPRPAEPAPPAAAPAPPPPVPAPTPPPPATDAEPVGAPSFLDREEVSWQRTAAWTSVGITLALGTTAAVLGLSAASREEDIQNLIEFRDTEGQPARYTGPTRDRYVDLVDEGARLERLAIVALAATGAAAATSVVFFLLDGAREPGAEAGGPVVAPAVGPGSAGLRWSGSF